jgi:hypothetical protein
MCPCRRFVVTLLLSQTTRCRESLAIRGIVLPPEAASAETPTATLRSGVVQDRPMNDQIGVYLQNETHCQPAAWVRA